MGEWADAGPQPKNLGARCLQSSKCKVKAARRSHSRRAATGALATTASQGLLLMLPNMARLLHRPR
jgi:hypothetical protein